MKYQVCGVGVKFKSIFELFVEELFQF